jgi:transcriptional regulator with XRE-family HTH domain
MVDLGSFPTRLQHILERFQLSGSALADMIGVQRSSISHILSGRNKPSLEFITKLMDHFPELSFEYLVKGEEIEPTSSEYIEEKVAYPPTLFDDIDVKDEKNQGNKLNQETKIPDQINKKTRSVEIERVMIFFKDGSYKEYKN